MTTPPTLSNYELIIMNYEWKKVAHDAGPAQSEAKGSFIYH